MLCSYSDLSVFLYTSERARRRKILVNHPPLREKQCRTSKTDEIDTAHGVGGTGCSVPFVMAAIGSASLGIWRRRMTTLWRHLVWVPFWASIRRSCSLAMGQAVLPPLPVGRKPLQHPEGLRCQGAYHDSATSTREHHGR